MNEFFQTRRMACCGTALIFLAVAFFAPGSGALAGYPFSARMTQHLLLQLVIPPLVLLSLPRIPRVRAPLRWMLTQPVLTWLCGLGAMWIWHAPALCNAAVRSPALHVVQLLSLALLGAVFWWPIAGPDQSQRMPPPAGMVYLFTACLGCTILGILIAFAPAGVYLTTSLPGPLGEWQFAAPTDQRIGGLLMWVPGCLVYASGILGLLARWYGAPQREALPVRVQERIS